MNYSPEISEVTIEEHTFDECCSIVEVGNANYEDAESLKAAVKAMIGSEGDESEGDCVNAARTGLIVWSLTSQQKEEIKVITEAGFVPLITFISPSTKHEITLYGLKVNQPVATRRRAARR